MFTKTGLGELGQITEEIAVHCSIAPGPIKLLNGVEGANGGFGREHIESHTSRMKQLEGMGYADVVSYIYFVVSNFTHLAVQEDGRLVIVRQDGQLFHHVICQWDEELCNWSVTTALPKHNMRKLEIIWSI
ncbi:hypothetical protein [Rhizobium ruizarguesonis]|uniref:hypothetical protein n=1 Tax=Rhizobium ruizarguesonis TaxID=2081791 RepID=UPI00102FA4FF|nr:hypothetical protein [Rhizobium ruizarguesonis]TBA38444.1 hypothetical protein ELH60_14000 [Rhizobium ruizarguesonis]